MMKVFSNGEPKVFEEFYGNPSWPEALPLAMATNSLSVITLVREAFIVSVKVTENPSKTSLSVSSDTSLCWYRSP